MSKGSTPPCCASPPSFILPACWLCGSPAHKRPTSAALLRIRVGGRSNDVAEQNFTIDPLSAGLVPTRHCTCGLYSLSLPSCDNECWMAKSLFSSYRGCSSVQDAGALRQRTRQPVRSVSQGRQRDLSSGQVDSSWGFRAWDSTCHDLE